MKGQLQFPEEPEKQDAKERFPVDKHLDKNEVFIVRGADGSTVIVMSVLGGTIVEVYQSDGETPLVQINTRQK